ncbi:MAG: Uma2 family endonuclease [Cyanobacteria bacterium J06634_6]
MVSQPVRLPSTAELPCSDDTPVDNEDQNLLPNLLLFVLASLWAERMDWYFGVDMAVYHTTGRSPKVPVVPDGFLSLGVERRKASQDDEGQTEGRPSYALWEESGIAPTMVLEMVSKTPGDEYDEKLEIYRRLGVLYYLVYNPKYWQRDRHLPFELYKLVESPEGKRYQLQMGEPCWMPEVGLGIGRTRKLFGGIEIEMLLWHNEQGMSYPLPEEALKQLQLLVKRLQQQLETERQRAELAEQQKARLAEYVRSLGIDPDNLPEKS